MAENVPVKLQVSVEGLSNIQKLNDQIKNLERDFGSFFDKMTNMAGALQAAFVATGAAVAKFADDISDVAAANDIAINQVTGLAKALALSGGNADAAGRLFQTFANSIEEANGGNEKTIKAFDQLGISIKDLGSLSQTELQDRVFKSLSNITDASTRNALAFELFGKTLVGVNLKEFTANLDEQRKKYEQYNGVLETAGNAFDKIGSILTDLKIAFAQTFEPVFKMINDMKISVEDLVVVWKTLAAVMVVATGAAVVGGLIKVINLLKVMNEVVSKNKLITIIGAVISLGGAAATYLGLTKDIDDAQQEVTKETEKTSEAQKNINRNQDGINDKRKKELDSLTKIREALDRQYQNLQDKLDLELKSLSLGEEQKRVLTEQAQIEQQGQQALINLKQAYEALDADGRARRATAYEQERQAILKNIDVQKAAAEERIRQIELQKNALKTLNDVVTFSGQQQGKILQEQARFAMEGMGYKDRIAAEEKLNQIVAIRQQLLTNAAQSGLGGASLDKLRQQINTATSDTNLLGKSWYEINDAILESIASSGAFTADQRNAVTQYLSLQMQATDSITRWSRTLSEIRQEQAEIQRSFSYGWSKAFREYADNATNAARTAENLFRKATQGMEDAIVNFAKTGKFEWKNFVNMMLEELLRANIQATIAGIMGAMKPPAAGGGGGGSILGSIFGGLFGGGGGQQQSTGGGGGGGSILGSIGSWINKNIFGGFFANGGMIPAGRLGIVGERGPELVAGPASVSPMAGTTVNYYIQAVDAPSFQALVARDPQFIYSVTEMGRKTIPGARA